MQMRLLKLERLVEARPRHGLERKCLNSTPPPPFPFSSGRDSLHLPLPISPNPQGAGAHEIPCQVNT